jgi:hypothetical protein
MSWKASLDAAVRALRKEERSLQRNLESVRDKIDELTSLAKSRAHRGRSGTAGPRRNRLSPSGRAAISRAAKRRWAKYRAQQKRKSS